MPFEPISTTEYIAELRSILSENPNKENWLQLRELWKSWPEQQFPEVISDYINAIGLEGGWKKYLPRVGYKSVEELTQAPGVERQIRIWREEIAPALVKACAELEQVLRANFQPQSEERQIANVTPNIEGFMKSLNMTEKRKFRRALLEQRALDSTVTLRINDSFYIEFENGQLLGSDIRGIYIKIRQEKQSREDVVVYCGWEEDEIVGWAENNLDPSWIYHDDEWF